MVENKRLKYNMMKKADLTILCLAVGMILFSCKPDPIDAVDTINPIDTADTVSPVDTVAPVNPIDTIAPIDTIPPIMTLCDSLFWGFWGVEKIEYYNIDYAGNPIEASMETFNMIPGDPQSGIDLIFRQNKTGEMRDRSQDTIYTWNPQTYQDDTIICPDSTIVKTFTYHLNDMDSTLIMNMDEGQLFRMNILEFTDSTFVYFNEYETDYVEKAYLVRLPNNAKATPVKQNAIRPNKPDSFIGGR